MPTDVTIVITCYNQRAYILEAIESARAQTVPCRVVVVDDGSTDGSAEAAEGQSVEVVRRPHRGAVETFRAGVEVVRSPFYCLLNGDDALEPRYVEATLPAMSDAQVGFVYTGWRFVGAREGVEHARPFNARELLFGNYVHAASLTRTRAYHAVGGFDRRFRDHFEDWALWVAMVAAGWKGAGVDQPLLRYRRHSGPSRNPSSTWALHRARLRLVLAHPALYGVSGYLRLSASSLRLAARSLASRREANGA